MEASNMEMVSRLLDEITSNTFEIGSWSWVDVVHINNPHSFYVRPRTYSRYLPLLQAKGINIDASEIHLGDIYVYDSYVLKCSVRGRMLNIDTSGDRAVYKLFAIDIGIMEDGIPLGHIWTTLYPLEVPSLVTHCQLADCAPKGEAWESEAIDAMKTFVAGERAKMIIRNKTADILTVELYNSRPDDIATLMALTNYTTFGYTGASASRLESPQVVRKYFAPRPMHIGDQIQVRMLSGILHEQFFVTPLDDYKLYLTDRDNFTHYARSQNEVYMEDLTLDAPIGVFHQKTSKYERGLLKAMFPVTNRARVQLVDLGITIEESIIKMKAIPDWYLRVPTRALFCTMHRDQVCSAEVAALSYPGMEFIITIKTIGDEDMMRPYVVLVTPLRSK